MEDPSHFLYRLICSKKRRLKIIQGTYSWYPLPHSLSIFPFFSSDAIVPQGKSEFLSTIPTQLSRPAAATARKPTNALAHPKHHFPQIVPNVCPSRWGHVEAYHHRPRIECFSTVAPWIAHSRAAPNTPATPIIWNGFNYEILGRRGWIEISLCYAKTSAKEQNYSIDGPERKWICEWRNLSMCQI